MCAHLAAMSCGNEPNLFANRVRPSGYGYAQYRPEFESCAAALKSGGAKVAGPNTNGGRWLSDFVADEHSRIVMLTDQQYTLGGGPKSTPHLARAKEPKRRRYFAVFCAGKRTTFSGALSRMVRSDASSSVSRARSRWRSFSRSQNSHGRVASTSKP